MIINPRGPSKWLKAADCIDGDLTLRIRTVREEKVGQEQQLKFVVYFQGEPRGFILNTCNAESIISMYGDETDNWRNQPITLYATDVSFGNDMVAALRVRKPQLLKSVSDRPAQSVQYAADRARTVADMKAGRSVPAAPALTAAPVAQDEDGDDCPF